MSRFSPRTKRGAAGAALLAGLAAQWPAHADPPAAPPTFATCAACHGVRAEGNPAGVPRLAGQNAGYLEHALATFKTGSRSSPVMQPIAERLSNADIHALASYLASLHGTAPTQAPVRPPSDLLRPGERLARVGALADPTPPCFSCHALGGSDNPRFPSIVGQPAAYVVNRLHDFQARARDSPPAPAT